MAKGKFDIIDGWNFICCIIFLSDCAVRGIECEFILRDEANNEQVDLRNLRMKQLIELVHKGDSEALDFLIHKYRNFVEQKQVLIF